MSTDSNSNSNSKSDSITKIISSDITYVYENFSMSYIKSNFIYYHTKYNNYRLYQKHTNYRSESLKNYLESYCKNFNCFNELKSGKQLLLIDYIVDKSYKNNSRHGIFAETFIPKDKIICIGKYHIIDSINDLNYYPFMDRNDYMNPLNIYKNTNVQLISINGTQYIKTIKDIQCNEELSIFYRACYWFRERHVIDFEKFLQVSIMELEYNEIYHSGNYILHYNCKCESMGYFIENKYCLNEDDGWHLYSLDYHYSKPNDYILVLLNNNKIIKLFHKTDYGIELYNDDKSSFIDNSHDSDPNFNGDLRYKIYYKSPIDNIINP